MKTPTLSICIPTYNSAKQIYQKANELLACDCLDFQLVISDNHSPDDTIERLSSIQDPRLKLVSLPENKGSTYNILHAFNQADGKYALICMDKDRLLPQQIATIVNILNELKPNFGYFKLDTANQDPNKTATRYPSVRDCLLEFAYKGMHPTGNFFSHDILQKYFADYHLADEKTVGGFLLDFMFAEAALEGNGLILDIPFCITTAPPFEGKTHSYTYSPAKKNVFFEPEVRFLTFQKQLAHCNQLPLKDDLKSCVLLQLVLNTYNLCTNGYAFVLTQKNICDWYNVTPRELSKAELKQISRKFICDAASLQGLNTLSAMTLLRKLLKQDKWHKLGGKIGLCAQFLRRKLL